MLADPSYLEGLVLARIVIMINCANGTTRRAVNHQDDRFHEQPVCVCVTIATDDHAPKLLLLWTGAVRHVV